MSSRHLISSGSPFETAYGYSRAVRDGDLIFVSGTTGYDYKAMMMPDDAAEQARNIFRTFADVLAQAGAEMSDIVSLRTFVTSHDHCEPVLRVQGEVFAAIRPAAAHLRDRGVAQAGNESRDRGGGKTARNHPRRPLK